MHSQKRETSPERRTEQSSCGLIFSGENGVLGRVEVEALMWEIARGWEGAWFLACPSLVGTSAHLLRREARSQGEMATWVIQENSIRIKSLVPGMAHT